MECEPAVRSVSRQCELAVWSVRNGLTWIGSLCLHLCLYMGSVLGSGVLLALVTYSTFEAARVQQRWKRAAGLLRGTMHDADCDCDWVAIERLEKVDLRLRQGCSGVELQRQGIAGLQRRGTAACAQAAERPSS